MTTALILSIVAIFISGLAIYLSWLATRYSKISQKVLNNEPLTPKEQRLMDKAEAKDPK